MVRSEKHPHSQQKIELELELEGLKQSDKIKPKMTLNSLARNLEFEAKETYSINSSTESDLLDF